MKNKKYLFSLALTSVFVAVTVVISRFLSINIWNMSIGFSFVSLMLCGMLLGAVWGGVCGAVADFIGALLFPFGPYFPGFTATAFLSGAVFGLVGRVAKTEKSRVKFIIFTTVLLALKEVVCSLTLNSLWISLLYSSPYSAVIISRTPLSVITLVFEIIFAVILRETLIPRINKEI